LTWENLEFTRLKVRVENNRIIREARTIRINNQNIKVSLEEEFPVTAAASCKGSRCSFDSSNSVTSTETYVEESTFSVKSDEVEGGRRAMEESQPRPKVVEGGEDEGGIE